MKLLIQPSDGVQPLLRGIASARKSIEIVIFRFDQREIERALANAVSRGIFVHALIAHTNRAGEEGLRRLEMRLLAAGVTVARTADDLVRYHNKLMIIDRRELYLLGFNYTHLDVERSRSFGIITRAREVVREAVNLFECDTKRSPYDAGLDTFVVSPVNARKQLAALLQSAKKELLIYDPRVSDPAMVRILEARAKAGVKVRVLGQMSIKAAGVSVHKLAQMRLHVRAIIRDNRVAFIGSQSLRALELDERREAGVIFRDPKIVNRMIHTFEEDWRAAEQSTDKEKGDDSPPLDKVARKVAKAVTKDMPSVAGVLNGAVKELLGAKTDLELNEEEVEMVVRDAVKAAVREVVREVVEDVVEQGVDAEEAKVATALQNGGGGK